MDDPARADPAAAAGIGQAASLDPGVAAPRSVRSAGLVERRGPADHRRLRPPTPRVALLVFAAVVVGFLLFLGRDALAPFVVGLLLVYLLDPPVERLGRLGVPRSLSILLVYAVAFLAVVEALNLTLGPLVDQIRQVVVDLPTLAASLDKQLQHVGDVYRGLNLPPPLRTAIDQWVKRLSTGGVGFDPTVLLPVVNATTGFISSLFGFFLIPVWVFYLLKDRVELTGAFDRTLPTEWRDDVWEVVTIVERVFGQWVRGQIILGFSVGFATFAGLLLLNQLVDPVFGRFALLLAIFAGVLELLPIIGPIIAAIPAILLAATAGPQAAIAALVLYTVVQQLENNLLVPKIQGDAVELHPSGVMFALVVGGAIAGLLGAILALPVTAAARDVYRYLFRRLSPPPIPGPSAAVAETLGGGDRQSLAASPADSAESRSSSARGRAIPAGRE